MSDTTDHTNDDTDEPRIPRARLNVEAQKRKDAERRAAELEVRLQELEDASKPDIERLTKQVEKLQSERDNAVKQFEQAQTEAQRSQRRSLVSDAAARLGFRDPSDATRFVDVDEIEDATSAERALKAVAKTKDYLLAPKTPAPRGLERVVGSGSHQDAAAPPGAMTEDEVKDLWGRQLLAGLTGASGDEPAAS